MDNSRFEDLNINPQTVVALQKARISNLKEILKFSLTELSLLVKRPEFELQHLMEIVSKKFLKSDINRVFALFTHDKHLRLSCSCPKLDKLLEGGLLTKTVTEFTGESGTGKTQFCMQLSIRAQLPINNGGLYSDIAYICTEDAFPSKRLKQMISEFTKENSTFGNHNFTDHIHVSHISNLVHLILCLRRDIPVLVKQKNIKLVVIDSVTAVIRGEHDRKDFIQRNKDLENLGYEIWKLAQKYDICVICVNQVSGNVRFGMNVPSLGLLWANVLTSRIMLFKTEIVSQENTIRNLRVIFSSYLPDVSYYYVIDESGIKYIDYPTL